MSLFASPVTSGVFYCLKAVVRRSQHRLMQGITQAIDPKDGMCIGVKHLHHNFKPMNNTELPLGQLAAISGGGAMGADGSTCTDRLI